MNYVEPIRDSDTVHAVGKELKAKNERDYIMFMVGIYSGLRISDILKLKIKDVKSRNSINIREKKTGKQRMFEINNALKRELEKYIADKDTSEYLIKSKKGCNKPLDRSQAYRILNKVGKQFKLEAIGTHTLRKTFGYHFYKQTKDIVTLQQIFNHSDPSVTLRYIGIEQEDINIAMKKFKI